MITIETYATLIPLGRKAKYGTLDVGPERFPANVQTYIYDYGLRQILNDACSEKKDDDGNDLSDEVIVAKALKRLDNMYAGELRARRDAAEPADPVEAEAWKMAKVEMTALYKKTPQWDAVPKGTKDRFGAVVLLRRAMRHLPELEVGEAVADAIEKFLAAPTNAYIRENAAEIVALRKGSAEKALDIDDLI